MKSPADIDGALRQHGLTPLDRAALLTRRRRIFKSSRPGGVHDPANGFDRKGDG